MGRSGGSGNGGRRCCVGEGGGVGSAGRSSLFGSAGFGYRVTRTTTG